MAARRLAGVLSSRMDDGLLDRARAMGADTLLQIGDGLNEAPEPGPYRRRRIGHRRGRSAGRSARHYVHRQSTV